MIAMASPLRIEGPVPHHLLGKAGEGAFLDGVDWETFLLRAGIQGRASPFRSWTCPPGGTKSKDLTPDRTVRMHKKKEPAKALKLWQA